MTKTNQNVTAVTNEKKLKKNTPRIEGDRTSATKGGGLPRLEHRRLSRTEGKRIECRKHR